MWYRTTVCVTGVLPDARVCYRRVTERPGVLRATGRPGVLPARYRTTGGATGVLPSDRVCRERPDDPVCCWRVTERTVCQRTTECVTGALPNDRVLPVCYRTTGRVTERPGVLPNNRVCYRCVVM